LLVWLPIIVAGKMTDFNWGRSSLTSRWWLAAGWSRTHIEDYPGLARVS